MTTYSSRITNEDGSWTAHIDKDGAICIRQEVNHYTGVKFESEADAQAWAEQHLVELEEQQAKAEVEIRKIDEIHAMLVQLTQP
jgi:glutathionylspermidine synthase